MKYSDLNFYGNRTSLALFTRAIRSHGNGSKMSPGMSCSNGADHMSSDLKFRYKSKGEIPESCYDF